MKISDLTIRSRLFAGNIITAVILITLCAIAWFSIQTLAQTERMVEHTHKVIKESNGLVNAMVDQETGLRGFAIGGQEEYLEPYISGKENFNDYLSTVKQLTSDNPAQQKRFDDIEKEARGWQAYAEVGLDVVQQTINNISTLESETDATMPHLTDLSQEATNIGGILDVILGIADQTNLLALNAAIEAARAGEQGRGFAVVADEVRELAKRTQNSTTEIQTLIERLQKGTQGVVENIEKSSNIVKATVEKAQQSGGSFNTISDSIKQIHSMSTQIAEASAEQKTTAEQINQSVIEVSQISRSSVSNAEKTVESGQELVGLSSQFHDIVGEFSIENPDIW
ncbi:methyl-accepting chemotaxis protein [Vibrio profundum]|uniref:methyl-accepting chemotaxis protein n=1 Tax=Vibrio profundum TaxID=2910247 RepID=UPI003D0E35B3